MKISSKKLSFALILVLAPLSLLLLNVTQAQEKIATEFEDANLVCEKKTKEYSQKYNVIDCKRVDWVTKPFGASYQQKNSDPMTATVKEIAKQNSDSSLDYVYRDSYTPNLLAIKNAKENLNGDFDGPGKPGHPQNQGLAWKVERAYSATYGSDNEIYKYFEDEWVPGMQPNSNSPGWAGSCPIYAMASMEPSLIQLLKDTKAGMMCSGIPFTDGELAEIFVSLYPEPTLEKDGFDLAHSDIESAKLNQTRSHHEVIDQDINPTPEQQDQVEDANLALAEAGMLGNSMYNPSDFIVAAQQAQSTGENLFMDREPGVVDGSAKEQNWNQPIKQVVDLSYTDKDNDILTTELSRITDFQGSGEIYDNLFAVDFGGALNSMLKMKSIDVSSMNDACKGLQAKNPSLHCDDVDHQTPLALQMEKYNQLKVEAVKQGVMKLDGKLKVVHHELIVDFGVEKDFASNDKDKMMRNTLKYVTFNSVDAQGNIGEVKRSQWLPDSKKLSDICSHRDQDPLADRRSSMITPTLNLDQKCQDLKNGKIRDQLYATSPMPPKRVNHFKLFSKRLSDRGLGCGPSFRSKLLPKERAFCSFMYMLGECDPIDDAVDFLTNLDQAVVKHNSFLPDMNSLLTQFQKLKGRGLLRPGILKERLAPYKNVPGFSQLSKALQQEDVAE